MSKRDKLLEKAKANPKGLRLAEFETLMNQRGWMFDHQTGSHRIWYSPEGKRLPVQEAKSGKAKGYQVKQFLVIYEEENE